MVATENKGKVVFGKDDVHFGYIKGKCKWAKVLQPDNYGNFSISMYVDDTTLDEHKELFNKMINDAAEAVKEVGKVVKGTADCTKEDKEGKEFFGFKLPAEGYEGKQNHIEIFDMYGKKVDDWDNLIGNDSTVKIKYMAKPYYMATTKQVGLSFRFYAVQIINLNEYSGAGSSGFGDETDSAPFDNTSEEF